MRSDLATYDFGEFPIWEMDIQRITGESLEAKNREEVNDLLSQGWILLHVYTLKYKEDNVWRERPMAILGKPTVLGEEQRVSH